MNPINSFHSGSLSWGRVAAVAVLALQPIGPANSDYRSTDEMQSRRNWFQSLFEPGTDSPCCDVADCSRTVAEWRRDGWWAMVQGKWRSVPQASILKTPHSIDGEAYVCSAAPTDNVRVRTRQVEPPIRCFVPPNMSS